MKGTRFGGGKRKRWGWKQRKNTMKRSPKAGGGATEKQEGKKKNTL